MKQRVAKSIARLLAYASVAWYLVVFAGWLARFFTGGGEAFAGESEDSQPEPENEEDPGRRRIMILVSAGAGGVLTAGIAGPVAAFLLAPMFRDEPPVWRTLGAVEDFNEGETVHVTFEDPSPLPWSGVTAHSAAWLRRLENGQFEAFSINCTHLGCAVRWQAGAELFMCPCHGGVFYRDGAPAAGPVRAPLARHDVRVVEGQVEIRTLGLPVTGPITAPETPEPSE